MLGWTLLPTLSTLVFQSQCRGPWSKWNQRPKTGKSNREPINQSRANRSAFCSIPLHFVSIESDRTRIELGSDGSLSNFRTSSPLRIGLAARLRSFDFDSRLGLHSVLLASVPIWFNSIQCRMNWRAWLMHRLSYFLPCSIIFRFHPSWSDQLTVSGHTLGCWLWRMEQLDRALFQWDRHVITDRISVLTIRSRTEACSRPNHSAAN